MNEKFYQKTWFIWLMIFVFWPIGLILLWTSKKYTTKIKLIISLLFVAIISFAMFNSSNKNQDNTSVSSSTSTTNSTETIKEKEISKEDEYNHITDAENILQKIYSDTAIKLGVGAPTVDVSFTSYRQWESAPGLTESEGNFELSSEEGLKHKFNIRWGKNSNDVIRIVIDGKRVYYNEDLQIKYMDNAN